MSGGQVEHEGIMVNDIVTLKRDTLFFSSKSKEAIHCNAGARCLVAEFSYRDNEPEALILEKQGENLNDIALATVAFDAVNFHARPRVT